MTQLYRFEAEPEMGRATHKMRLMQAATAARPTPGLYVLLRGGRPVYTGKSINLRVRMQQYVRHIRILRCGNISEYSVRLTYMPRAGAATRGRLEGRLIRQINRKLRKQKRAPLSNKQLAELLNEFVSEEG